RALAASRPPPLTPRGRPSRVRAPAPGCQPRPRRGDVAGDDRPRADEGTAPDPDSAEDDCARADRRAALHRRAQQRPVGSRPQASVARRGGRELVVDEHDAVPDEHLVADLDAVADEGMALDLAAAADRGAALDLDEGADARLVADAAAVQVR